MNTVTFKELKKLSKTIDVLSQRPVLPRTQRRCITLADFKELLPDTPEEFLLAWIKALDANDSLLSIRRKYWLN